MAEHILLVFEGAKTERQIHSSLKQFFLNESPDAVICAIFGSHIYSLYHTLENDPDLDLFGVLKEDTRNDDLLEGVSSNDVSQIYLFFDYDGHDPAASSEKLSDMLSRFNEETDSGKLYISYPMVEALKHLGSRINFKNLEVSISDFTEYKKTVSYECEECYQNLTALSLEHWNHFISEHCKKMNWIVNDSFILPESYIPQNKIYESQKAKFIDPSNKVSVLSAFPVFIVDYYGCAYLPLILGRNE